MKRFLSWAILLLLPLAGCKPSAHGDPVVAQSAPSVPGASQPVASPAVVPKVPIAFTPKTEGQIPAEEVPLLEQINRENIRVIASALPAMVRISAVRSSDNKMQIFGNDLPFQFHFHGPRPPGTNDPSYGSGVVISSDGYIVTNNHVVDGFTDFQVQLEDKRVFVARLVAGDAPVDIAVLKIDATDLTPIPWGDSDKAQVGEQVFCIGNPFDLDNSVSRGIVSAMGRNLPDEAFEAPHYENYIQTDAAINPGNSGGALINIHGELIGINTAIASYSRGNEGVGFAIPGNFARFAIQGLLKEGHLVRGYLGVKFPTKVDDGVMKALNLNVDKGALLAGVQPSSPAARAGLQAGDFVIGVDGHTIKGEADLRLIVAQIPIGKEVPLSYIRDGTAQQTKVTIGEPQVAENDGATSESPRPIMPVAPAPVENVLTGLQAVDLDAAARTKYNVDAGVAGGIVVSDVKDGSLPDTKGLVRGDVLESACVDHGANLPLKAAKDFTDLFGGLKPEQSVVLLVHHGKGSSFIYLAPQR